MKTQISRWTDDPAKRRSGIYQQQGRMISDADLNELVELLKRRVDAALGEVVGNGVPRTPGAGVGLVSDGPTLRPGTLYADGVRARLEPASAGVTSFTLQQQADFPAAPAWPGGNQVLYADVWELATTALQDASLLDPGLHGADTTTRTQILAQVKWCPTDSGLGEANNPAIGNATLELAIRQGGEARDECDPCATAIALDARVGNYLFRLEVHDVQGAAGEPDALTLKWSSENAAEHHLQADVPAEFKRGNWIYEFFSDTTERHLGVHHAGSFTPQRAILKDGWPDAAQLPDKDEYPYVRRWDGCCTLAQAAAWSLSGAATAKDKGLALVELPDDADATHGHYELDDDYFTVQLAGLTLKLALNDKKFVAGDYWLAAVREDAVGAARVQPAQSTPVGIVHRYLRLASADGATVTPFDDDAGRRRLSFPPLTNLKADRVGYDNEPAQDNWRDILEVGGPALPDNVQQALDLLVQRLESSDIGYQLPDCAPLAHTLRSLLWDAAAPTAQKIKDVLTTLLCQLDSSKIPYSAGDDDNTVKDKLDALRTDVDAKVNRAGDTMTGALRINAGLQVDGDCTVEGNLTVRGTTTTINVNDLVVEDRIVMVNRPETATGNAGGPASPTTHSGLEVFRGNTDSRAQLIWDESDDRWKVGVAGSLQPIATGQAQDFVTGTVEFIGMPLGAEIFSNAIDPGLGAGKICVHLAIDGGSTVTIGDTGYGRATRYYARVNPANGTFQIFAQRNSGSSLPVSQTVRWWAMKPGQERGETDVAIGITLVPASVTVTAGTTHGFTATMSQTNADPAWSVQEAGGGSVVGTNKTAVYTAPSTPGTYHVVATCGSTTASATVTVAPLKNVTKDSKDLKDAIAEKLPTKDLKDGSPEKSPTKDAADTGGGKAIKDASDSIKPREFITPPGEPLVLDGTIDPGAGRSFIRPIERPDISLPPPAGGGGD